MRRTAAAVTTALLLAAPLTGCGRDQDNKRVCEDAATHVRVDDNRCDRSNNVNFVWLYFLTRPRSYPAVGQRITGNTTRQMPKGFKTAGSSVPRGGTKANSKQGGSGSKVKNGSGSRQGGGSRGGDRR